MRRSLFTGLLALLIACGLFAFATPAQAVSTPQSSTPIQARDTDTGKSTGQRPAVARSPHIIRVAHRGSTGKVYLSGRRYIADDDTCGSAIRAARLYAVNEGDLRLTADHVLVYLHDDNIAVTTNGRGLVRNMTFAKLERYHTRHGWRVPSLQGLLGCMKRNLTAAQWQAARFQSELKVLGRNGEVAKQAVDIFRSFGKLDQVMFTSFNRHNIEVVSRFAPRNDIGFITNGRPTKITPVANWLMVKQNVLSASYVQYWHQKGIHVSGRSVNTKSQTHHVVASWGDRAVSDVVGKLNKWLRSYRR